jgi:hypothetical protein
VLNDKRRKERKEKKKRATWSRSLCKWDTTDTPGIPFTAGHVGVVLTEATTTTT